ncbi:acyltransferase domain-containing protein [Streptomyces sp. M19]
MFAAAGPRWTGPDPVAAAVARLRDGDCRTAVVIAASAEEGRCRRPVRHRPLRHRPRGLSLSRAAPGRRGPGRTGVGRRRAPARPPGPGRPRPRAESQPKRQPLRPPKRPLTSPSRSPPSRWSRCRSARTAPTRSVPWPAICARTSAHTRSAARGRRPLARDHPNRPPPPGRCRRAVQERIAAALDRLAHGRPDADLVRGTAADRGRIAFVCPGHGPQWPGMAAELFEASPLFAERLTECADVLAPHVDWPVLDVLLDAARDEPGTPATDTPRSADRRWPNPRCGRRQWRWPRSGAPTA